MCVPAKSLTIRAMPLAFIFPERSTKYIILMNASCRMILETESGISFFRKPKAAGSPFITFGEPGDAKNPDDTHCINRTSNGLSGFGEDRPEESVALLETIADRFPEITSLLYVVNLKLNDTISDQEIHSFRGPEYIEEEMEGLKFRVNAKSFLPDQFSTGIRTL